MIEITGRSQFAKTAEGAGKEHMRVRRHEAGLYEVANQSKGHSYHVRFERVGGKVIGTCTCEAGTPHQRPHVPAVCEHLLAAVIVHRAVVRMRRAAVQSH